MPFKWIGWGAVIMGLAVVLGAFGAHVLEARLDQYRMEIYEKGVFYHFVHGMAILVISAMVPELITPTLGGRICTVFVIGLVFFSGSLYALAISDIKEFGAITPIGGIAFLLGWIILAWTMLGNM